METRSERKPQHSAKFLRQRKFLLVLPVLTLPFLGILLWTLGLVGNSTTTTDKKLQGLNLDLPAAAPSKDSNWNKLKYYEQADKDSMKLQSLLKNDPYRKLELETKGMEPVGDGFKYSYDPYPTEKSTDYNERRLYQKLNALNRELETAAGEQRPSKKGKEINKTEVSLPSADVDRLEKMMQTMQRGQQDGEDPEMAQLNQTLERILDIQNPQRVQEKLRQQSVQNKQLVYAVEKLDESVVSVLQPKKDFTSLLEEYKSDSIPKGMKQFMESNRFYSFDENSFQETMAGRSIAATVPEDQTMVSGSIIKLRLMEDVFIAGVSVPKDHFVYGQATLNGERLQVVISSIEHDNHLLPVELTVYDKRDGLPGIHIPGALSRGVVKRSAGQSMQGLSNVNTLNPSIGAQMITTGIEAVQNLVGKSAKLVRVTVKAGYPVLLKDDNQKDN